MIFDFASTRRSADPASALGHARRFARGTALAFVVSAMLAFLPLSAAAQAVGLGTAGSFGVLAGAEVTNTGPTVVNGNVGVWPGTSITGFPPGSIAPGSGAFHSGNTVAQTAQADLTTAYLDAAGRACGTTIPGGILGGLTLTPGVYCMGAADLTGTLTLNGNGIYIFQVASALTTAPGSQVLLTGGASACNVFWQVTSSAALGTTTSFAGTILALTSITINTGASLNGRALARNGLVSLASNGVLACSGGNLPPGPPPPPPVPQEPRTVPLSSAALLALGALLGFAGFVVLKRGRPPVR